MPKLTFEQVWNLNLPWYESPNQHRGGWSGVFKWCPKDSSPLFVKKQENYIKRTLLHPIRGILMASYEHRNLIKLARLAIPAPEVAFFSERRDRDRRQALLVTQSLEGYQPLDVWLSDKGDLSSADKMRLREALVTLLSKLHRHRYAHCSLYPKHIFIRQISRRIDLAFIDLEKLRFKPFRFLCSLHDLNKLNRHLYGVSYRDRCLFLKAYLKQMGLMNYINLFKWYLWKKYRKP